MHVSVAGYLSTARMAVDIGGGAATLLAGWDADQTLWLRGQHARYKALPRHRSRCTAY